VHAASLLRSRSAVRAASYRPGSRAGVSGHARGVRSCSRSAGSAVFESQEAAKNRAAGSTTRKTPALAPPACTVHHQLIHVGFGGGSSHAPAVNGTERPERRSEPPFLSVAACPAPQSQFIQPNRLPVEPPKPSQLPMSAAANAATTAASAAAKRSVFIKRWFSDPAVCDCDSALCCVRGCALPTSSPALCPRSKLT
jgi:hypothetical protein